MNIYLSKLICSLYFYDRSVTIPLTPAIVNSNVGVSYVLHCICNGINDIDQIANKLIDKFNIKDDLPTIGRMILSNTIGNKSIKEAFTLDVTEANLSPKISGAFGARYPQILHVELTSACNYSCGHCYKNATYAGESIDYAVLREKIYNTLKGIVPVIHFTGGEPTLHKDFAKIVDMFSTEYNLQLTTNGSNIKMFPIEVFKKFQAIDISLYGLSAEEYKANTGNEDAFKRVNAAFDTFNEEGIGFRVTVVLNNDNRQQMEDYINFAIDIGAESIGFALPMSSGKLLGNSDSKWHLTEKTQKEIYKEFRLLKRKYDAKITILDWYRSEYSNMWKSTPSDGSLRCGAGKNVWWMSETCHFKPCSFLPDQYMNLDYETWHSYITYKCELDWNAARNSIKTFSAKHELDETDICSVFRGAKSNIDGD